MIITFSPQVPFESNSVDEKLFPFKNFLIENTKSIQISKFEKKNLKPKTTIPKCCVCDMHYSKLSFKNPSEKSWICAFCGKENKNENVVNLNVGHKYYLHDEISIDDIDIDVSSVSDLLKPKNLTILLVDMSKFMDNIQVKVNNNAKITYMDWIAFLMKRDLGNLPPGSKFCVILCGIDVLVMGNSTETSSNKLSYPQNEKLKNCYETGQALSHELFSFEPYEDMINNFKNHKPFGLNSMGAGLAVALGILSVVRPVNNKIIVIGEGTSFLGFANTYEYETLKDVTKELIELRRLVQDPKDLNIELYAFWKDDKFSFFRKVSEVFNNSRYEVLDNNDDFKNISLIPNQNNNKMECMIRISATSNIALSPCECENLKKEDYNFEDKGQTWVMKNVNPNYQLYPFNFDFSTKINNNNTKIGIQVEYLEKLGGKLKTYVTTKQLEMVYYKDLDFTFLNFTVANYCYYINDFLKNGKKSMGYLDLINNYLKGRKSGQISAIKMLKYYMEKNMRIRFDVNFPPGLKEEALTQFLPMNKNNFKVNDNDKIEDFQNITRISKKKTLQRKY